MKKRVEIGLILFLLLFFVSIDDPMVHMGDILRRIPKLEKPAQYACIAELISENQAALFFSNPDGTLNWNTYNFQYSRAQYGLVPRVIKYIEAGAVDWDGFQWFLVQGMQPDSIAQTASQHGLSVVQTCNKMTVLARK